MGKAGCSEVVNPVRVALNTRCKTALTMVRSAQSWRRHALLLTLAFLASFTGTARTTQQAYPDLFGMFSESSTSTGGASRGWQQPPRGMGSGGAPSGAGASAMQALPAFLKMLLADLASITDVDNDGPKPGGGSMNAADIIAQAQSWADGFQAKLAVNKPGVSISLDKKQEDRMKEDKEKLDKLRRSPPPPPPATATKQTILAKDIVIPTLEMVNTLLSIKPTLKRVYFNYWNSTFTRYFSYADQAKQAKGLNPNVPLTDQLVARFREATGTTCTPASFTPPRPKNATITGQALTLTFNAGNCQLTRIASQTRKDRVLRCALPRTALVIAQPRYTSKFVAPAAFSGSVCRRQYTYGLASNVRIELWNPGDFADKTSTLSRLLPLSDADGNGIPNFIDKLGKYNLVRKVLRTFRADLTKTLTDTTTPTEAKANRLMEKLQDKLRDVGLNITIGGEFQARRDDIQTAKVDLLGLFPKIESWELGTGVSKIYDGVLEQGLMATLYLNRGNINKGLFSMFSSSSSKPDATAAGGRNMGQSRASQQSAAGAADGGGGDTLDEEDAGEEVPQDIFKRLADEMEKVLESRAVDQETARNPPTGRKVVKRRDTKSTANMTAAGTTTGPGNTTQGSGGTGPTTATSGGSSGSAAPSTTAQGSPESGSGSGASPGGTSKADDANSMAFRGKQGGRGRADETPASAAAVAAAAVEIIEGLGEAFTAANQWEEDGGVEVPAE